MDVLIVVVATVPVMVGIIKPFMTPAVLVDDRNVIVIVVMVLDASSGVTDTNGRDRQPPCIQYERLKLPRYDHNGFPFWRYRQL